MFVDDLYLCIIKEVHYIKLKCYDKLFKSYNNTITNDSAHKIKQVWVWPEENSSARSSC